MSNRCLTPASLLLLLTVSLASPAAGQVGPDVIVGDLHQVASYGSSGAYHAYAVGTTSCNIGDTNLLWISGTNEHPVIGQELYRLKDGRFEQVGLSWLKHGFFALSQSLCAPCNPTDGTTLGVGCSDPYSASLNGSQSNLGPRSQVNAFTGEFPYPFSAPGFSGSVARRLRVASVDVDPAQNPGALYFVTGHYITQDDAQSGNGENNCSYRPVAIANDANFTLSFIGGQGTRQQDPGIQAWQDNQPSVVLEDFRVPGEGLFIVGYDVTNNGDGTWHYEYAVFNMNSDRSGQSFTVEVPAGVTLTNVGFHDVDHHSGEPYSLTDWSFTQTASGAIWQTTPFAVDPNANALRWSTLYNFRFDANVPPAAGVATIGLFKPGATASVSGAILAPTGGSLDCNANGIPDLDDVASGTSPDCNGNGVPDECEEDCNLNGVPDGCDIAGGLEADCDLDGIPDSCALASGAASDCDGDGILDSCELAAGTDTDCDLDGAPDSCQIAAGAADCDTNGVLDICESSGLEVHDRIISPPLSIISNGGPAIDTLTITDSGVIEDVDVAIEITHTWIGDLVVTTTSPAGTSVVLHQTSGGNTDDLFATYDDELAPGTISPAQPLSGFDGEDRSGAWTLTASDAVSGDNGALHAWSLFLQIQGAAIVDCNGNQVDDACEIAGGTALDCDGNGVPDDCDLASGAADCDLDGVPDGCQIAAGTGSDCDGNGSLDSCDIAGDPALDCDGNGLIDGCELAGGTGSDCNLNGVPDSCDIASGASSDANGDGIPDECAPTPFLRGDANGDDAHDISDPITLLLHLFEGAPLVCLDAADLNDDGALDVSDVIGGLAHTFGVGPVPPSPFPTCGADPSPDPLGCGSHPACP